MKLSDHERIKGGFVLPKVDEAAFWCCQCFLLFLDILDPAKILDGFTEKMLSKTRISVSLLRKSRELKILFHQSHARQIFNQPLSGHDMPRAGGIASMMRLPMQNTTEGKLDT